MLKKLFLATRPQTYPLAIASMLYPQSLAYQALGGFSPRHWLICVLSILTALSLQIISNLANDYGDAIKGVDAHRDSTSPKRAMASGELSASVMKNMLKIWSVITIILGLSLLAVSIRQLTDFMVFFVLGIASILGAFAYTMGKYPYGYRAMGELFVLVFFGYVAVFGGYYLLTGKADIAQNLPVATGVGLLSACVLYVNNLRDINSDRLSGKRTLAIVLGRYHIVGYLVLLYGSMMCYGYHAVVFGDRAWALALCLPLLVKHTHAVITHRHSPARLGKQLGAIVGLVIVVNALMIGLVGV